MSKEVQTGRRGLLTLGRLVARGFTVLLASMVLLFLFGEPPANQIEVSPVERLQMAAFFLVVIGLLVAWRWEWQGALASLLSLGAFYGLEFAAKGRLPGGIFPVFAIPALLYLLCSTLDRRASSMGSIAGQPDPLSPRQNAPMSVPQNDVGRIDQPSFQS